ncbi:hypothetical protein F4561_003384 [Lipingzhangella halophila]|uniref:Uncharacterized protein n=1 Tax=Lipingzhangella halophila TaxID=1783352 RepID=A0A7W7W478_9ACTN|nr:hypothetical protein [Lipingzhangella halophila]MBB4932564.1 hypothetical protein [Lipingzhangella halophila]
MSSDTRNTSDGARAGRPRHGFLAWLVFILAIGTVLTVVAGCMAMVYGPMLTGG